MKIQTFARLAAVALLANVVLVACSSSPDGMMSDEEKLKAAGRGRESYMKGGNKPASGTPSGQATGN